MGGSLRRSGSCWTTARAAIRGAELAYWVRPEKRRCGVALRAVRGLTEWAHRHAGTTRLWLEIDPANVASLGLAQKAGYQLEQCIARHCRLWVSDDPKHDRWRDCSSGAHHAVTCVHALIRRRGGQQAVAARSSRSRQNAMSTCPGD
jgi:RimJ/RimL family protein N-acetyltransferase